MLPDIVIKKPHTDVKIVGHSYSNDLKVILTWTLFKIQLTGVMIGVSRRNINWLASSRRPLREQTHRCRSEISSIILNLKECKLQLDCCFFING